MITTKQQEKLASLSKSWNWQKNLLQNTDWKICTLSITTGVLPESLKIAQVAPVCKKGSKVEYCNYRPIFLLSNLCKIFGKLMH